MNVNPGQALEYYTLNHPQEVLIVEAEIRGEFERVMIFKGMSSSLMGATNPDPDIPLLPQDAVILSIARLHSPYSPTEPRYIERELTWAKFQSLLT
jgi:hypothetical protein